MVGNTKGWIWPGASAVGSITVPESCKSSVFNPDKILSTTPVFASESLPVSIIFSGGVPFSHVKNSVQNHGVTTSPLTSVSHERFISPVVPRDHGKWLSKPVWGKSIIPVRSCHGVVSRGNLGQENFSDQEVRILSFHVTKSFQPGKTKRSARSLPTLTFHSLNCCQKVDFISGSISSGNIAHQLVPVKVSPVWRGEVWRSNQFNTVSPKFKASVWFPVVMIVPVFRVQDITSPEDITSGIIIGPGSMLSGILICQSNNPCRLSWSRR